MSSLVELSKAWKGEKGDKRNTKYAAAAYGGALAASAPLLLSRDVRRISNVGGQRYARAMYDVPVGDKATMRSMAARGGKALLATPGMKRMLALSYGAYGAGALAGAGGYAAYRKKKRQNVEKALPTLGSFKPLGEAFMRGTKGRKMGAPKKPTGAIPSVGQMRANQAGLFVNRYRTPLTAVGAGGAAGAGAGYMAGRKKDD